MSAWHVTASPGCCLWPSSHMQDTVSAHGTNACKDEKQGGLNWAPFPASVPVML